MPLSKVENSENPLRDRVVSTKGFGAWAPGEINFFFHPINLKIYPINYHHQRSLNAITSEKGRDIKSFFIQTRIPLPSFEIFFVEFIIVEF